MKRIVSLKEKKIIQPHPLSITRDLPHPSSFKPRDPSQFPNSFFFSFCSNSPLSKTLSHLPIFQSSPSIVLKFSSFRILRSFQAQEGDGRKMGTLLISLDFSI